MRAIILALVLVSGCSCKARVEIRPGPDASIDAPVDAWYDSLTHDEFIKELEDAVNAILGMIDCLNTTLDNKKMSDRDQVLKIESCMQEAGYRR